MQILTILYAACAGLWLVTGILAAIQKSSYRKNPMSALSYRLASARKLFKVLSVICLLASVLYSAFELYSLNYFDTEMEFISNIAGDIIG